MAQIVRTSFAKSVLAVALLTIIFGTSAYAGILATRDAGRIAAIWVPNALLLATLFRLRTALVCSAFASCFVANVCANLAVGDTNSVAFSLAVSNSLEVLIALMIIRRFCPSRPSFSEMRELGIFASATLAASFASSLFTTALMTTLADADPLQLFWSWLRADCLGLLIVTPAITILADGWRNRSQLTRAMLLEGVAIIAFGSAVSAYTFWQSKFPFLFLDAPLVLLYAFRLGPIGNAIAIVNLAIIASIATGNGHGPINLVEGDMGDKLFVLQVFLASSFAIGLPISALLKSKREVEVRFRQIAELSPVGIFRTDGTAKISYGNAAFWGKIGGRDQLEHSHVWQAISSEGNFKSGDFTSFDKQADQTLKVRTREITKHGGTPDGILGVVVDISNEVRAQKRLTEAKRTFETLAELSPAGIFRTDAKGACTYVNRAWERLAGIHAYCAMGAGWTGALHPDCRAEVTRQWSKAAKDCSSFDEEFRFLHEDGKVVWVAAMARPEVSHDGTITGFIGVALNITHRKQSERDLIAAMQAADQAALSKSQFLANMSHEIRTPMNGVLGFAQMLAEDDLTEQQQRRVQMIIQSGTMMLDLLNDILDISKMEAGKLSLHSEPMNVRQQVELCVEGLRPLATAKGIALINEIGASVPDVIKSDQLRFRQVLSNLIGNAIKFTESGHVAITVDINSSDAGDEMLNIRIDDTGIGISPDSLESIFEYFEQAQPSVTTQFGGTGLGLAITKTLVGKFNGVIDVQSVEGSGSSFTVRMPIDRFAPDHSLEAAKPSPVADRQITPLGPMRVLVAEDNEINRLLLKSMLHRFGQTATFASNGEEVLNEIEAMQKEERAYDLILMDIRMPVMDGIEATRRLRERGYSPTRLPIVALTANSFPEDVERCLDAGMQGHLSKPLYVDELRACLARFTPSRPQSHHLQKKAKAMGGPVSLQERFDTQKARLFAAIDTLLNAPEAVIGGDLEKDLHQLSGTAAYFGEADLGNACRDGEAALKSLSGEALKVRLEEIFATAGMPGLS